MARGAVGKLSPVLLILSLLLGGGLDRCSLAKIKREFMHIFG